MTKLMSKVELCRQGMSPELVGAIKNSEIGTDLAEYAALESIDLRRVRHMVLLATKDPGVYLQDLRNAGLLNNVEGYFVEKGKLWLFVRSVESSTIDQYVDSVCGLLECTTYTFYTRCESRRIDDISRNFRLLSLLANNDVKYTTPISEIDGLMTFFNSPKMSPADKRSIVNRIVGAVWEDRVMSRTVEALFQADLNTSRAAKSLGVHRNTLIYRMHRIEEITGVNLSNFYDAKKFYLCWLAKKIQ